MPNHVTNVVTFEGDPKQIQKMLMEIKDDDAGVGSIDFEKLIPMPKALEIESGSRTWDGLKAYSDFISVYVFDRDPATLDLLNIPKESEVYLNYAARCGCKNTTIFLHLPPRAWCAVLMNPGQVQHEPPRRTKLKIIQTEEGKHRDRNNTFFVCLSLQPDMFPMQKCVAISLRM